jgi:Uma2 family endonuclease
MDSLLSPLIESPRLVQYLEELQSIVAAERAKREQFYEHISPEDKWEFINGEIIMHSPATAKHTQVRARISRLLGVYVEVHKLGMILDEKALVSFTRNDYEPDVSFFPTEVAQHIEPDQWKLPVPDLIVEVLSPSSIVMDRGTKFRDYEAHRVTEYWIVDPVTETIEQHLLEGGAYRLNAKQQNGSLQCVAVPSFTMPVRAAFDDAENLKALWALQPKS